MEAELPRNLPELIRRTPRYQNVLVFPFRKEGDTRKFGPKSRSQSSWGLVSGGCRLDSARVPYRSLGLPGPLLASSLEKEAGVPSRGRGEALRAAAGGLTAGLCLAPGHPHGC